MELSNLKPCADAAAWLKTQPDPETAWNTCTRPEWMLWLLSEINYQNDRQIRLFACWCVRNTPLSNGQKVWGLLTDPRSKTAVEVAERFAIGEATEQELAAAWAAAGDAAWDAAGDAAWAAARAAARDAAGDAAWAAARAAAWDAAWAAAGDAAWAAARDAEGTAAQDSARAAARDAQSVKLREMVPFSEFSHLLVLR